MNLLEEREFYEKRINEQNEYLENLLTRFKKDDSLTQERFMELETSAKKVRKSFCKRLKAIDNILNNF